MEWGFFFLNVCVVLSLEVLKPGKLWDHTQSGFPRIILLYEHRYPSIWLSVWFAFFSLGEI